MLSLKSPSLFLLRVFAVVVCSLSLVPARVGRSFAVSVDPANAVTFAAAAGQNAKLKADLTWTFGARRQRGWRLYRPLIQRLLNTGAAPETTAFAQAVAGWQESAGLPSTGVLDQQTWMKMVEAFQSRRIKHRSTPPPEALTRGDASEFFDPERPEDL